MNKRLKRTRSKIKKSTRRKRPVAKQIYPKHIERDYARALLRVQRRIRSELQPLFKQLPSLLSSNKKELERLDANELAKILKIIRSLKPRLKHNIPKTRKFIRRFVNSIDRHQHTQLQKQTRAAIGIDLLKTSPKIKLAADVFVAENVALIVDMTAKTLSEIEGIVIRGVSEGQLHGTIAKQMRDRLGIGERRAKNIARDQVGKFYGQVTKHRQEQLGVSRFIWRTVQDERVREEHEALNGEIFEWRSPPSEGTPGQPINCRCYADPVLEDLLT